MLVHELTLAQCEEVLARATVGRLACARHDQPYVVPISLHFDISDKALYSFSTVGQKVDWMRANPKVCVEVDEIHEQLHWTTIVVFGRYEEIGHSEEEHQARQRAYELFQQRADWWLPGLGKLTTGEEHSTPVIYRVRVDRMTGRRAMREPSVRR
jgi:nitroimidazol reductase NimA-like FMN-containing flavoprotein (pyridoxamine 5'-phosphate oxidase superfamily)